MGRKRDRRDYTLGTRKKPCPIDLAKINKIDHKDVELLKLFITEKGKIIPGRANNISAKNQNKLEAAIKRARNIALLSFIEGLPTIKADEALDETIVNENVDISDDINEEYADDTVVDEVDDASDSEKLENELPSASPDSITEEDNSPEEEVRPVDKPE